MGDHRAGRRVRRGTDQSSLATTSAAPAHRSTPALATTPAVRTSRPPLAPGVSRPSAPAAAAPLAPTAPAAPPTPRYPVEPVAERPTEIRSRSSHRAGHRRADVATRTPFSAIPIAPTVAGAAAIAVAAGGAVTLGTGSAGAAAVGSDANFNTAGFSDVSAMSNAALGDRSLALSRDSARDAAASRARAALQDTVDSKARERNSALTSLAKSAKAQSTKIAANRWTLPVAAGAYHLTARFGQSSGLWSHMHTGLDFAAPSGTPIQAVANGTITETGWAGSYGNRTIETLDDGTEIWYCHQSVIGVHTGDLVRGGEQIGNVGSTGNTTGPHLHLEVRPNGGDPVDPYPYLLLHGLQP